MTGRSATSCWIPNATRRGRWWPTGGCWGCPSRRWRPVLRHRGRTVLLRGQQEFGLQYLFGIIDTDDTDDTGLPRYTQFWAFDRAGEKRAFEELIDFITVRRQRHPGLHVYHYNHYEPTSVDHLTELHETRQEAVGR